MPSLRSDHEELVDECLLHVVFLEYNFLSPLFNNRLLQILLGLLYLQITT